MSDLINRQDAIDAVMDLPNCDNGYSDTYDKAQIVGVLEDVPSAEPEQAIKDCRNCKHGAYNDHWDTYFCYCLDDCNDWNKWEPSAQSDFCEGCKHIGLWESEVEYGYSSPCTRCKRRASDNYER